MAQDRPCAKLPELLMFFLLADSEPAHGIPQDDDGSGRIANHGRGVGQAGVLPLLGFYRVIA